MKCCLSSWTVQFISCGIDLFYHVVISHGQTEHLGKFPEGSVYVFDAITDADMRVCAERSYPYVNVAQPGNRGMNRDAGLSYVLSSYAVSDDDVVEFFDGDRYPTTYRPEAVQELMDGHDIGCMLYSCDRDTRHGRIYVPLRGATLVDTGTLCNPFYSCGFAMKVGAIRKVMQFNGGSLFEHRFTRWGCEDQYLGLVCERQGIRVALTCETLLNGDVGGDQFTHSDYRESLQQYVDIIREKGIAVRNEPRPSVEL